MTTTLIAPFLAVAEQFAGAVRDLPEHRLDCSAAPGEWSIRQIVHHVADDGDAWSFALKRAIACPGAPQRFEAFPGNEPWANALGFDRRPIRAALDLLLAHRRLMAEIAADLPEDCSPYYIEIFDDKGQNVAHLDAAQIIQMLTSHLEEHLQTVRTILGQTATA